MAFNTEEKASYQESSMREDLLEDEQLVGFEYRPRSRNRLLYTLCAVVAILFGIIALLILQLSRGPSQLECAKLNSPYSPVWEAVEFWEADFQNDFPHKSKYRGPPTPERDQAWADLWLHPTVPVSLAGLAKLNKSELAYVESTDSTGDAVSMLEVFHQLHCLNLIRQYTWRHLYDQDQLPSDLSLPVEGRMHVDHCIETLRLSLMCYADVTPLLVYNDPESPIGIRADFNVHHKCRNFDRLVEYVDEKFADHQQQQETASDTQTRR